MLIVGASLTGFTVTLNELSTVSPPESVARIVIIAEPELSAINDSVNSSEVLFTETSAKPVFEFDSTEKVNSLAACSASEKTEVKSIVVLSASSSIERSSIAANTVGSVFDTIMFIEKLSSTLDVPFSKETDAETCSAYS